MSGLITYNIIKYIHHIFLVMHGSKWWCLKGRVTTFFWIIPPTSRAMHLLLEMVLLKSRVLLIFSWVYSSHSLEGNYTGSPGTCIFLEGKQHLCKPSLLAGDQLTKVWSLTLTLAQVKVEPSLNETILVNGWLRGVIDAVNNEPLLNHKQNLFASSCLMFNNEQKRVNYNNHKQLVWPLDWFYGLMNTSWCICIRTFALATDDRTGAHLRPGPATWRKEMQGRSWTRTHSRDGHSCGNRSGSTSLPAEHTADCRSRSRDVRERSGAHSGGSHRSRAQPRANVLERWNVTQFGG